MVGMAVAGSCVVFIASIVIGSGVAVSLVIASGGTARVGSIV